MSFEDEMKRWLDANPPMPKDPDPTVKKESGSGTSRRKLQKMSPQKTIDLHGLTAAEAEETLNQFLDKSSSQGLKKVLIIHGKGFHSAGEPVLKPLVLRVLDRRPDIRSTGPADRTQGGSGATWVIFHQRSR